MRGSPVLAVLALLSAAACTTSPTETQIAPAAPQPRAQQAAPAAQQRGTATYYARSLANQKMADGTPFNPESDSAASKTLPLGSKAEVKNLSTGKTATVTIRDRGPHVKGAIIDVSPKTADALGMKKSGKAPVVVTPLNSQVAER